MKGKKVFKKIVASALTLAIVFSNISVSAENQADHVEIETQEDMPSDEAVIEPAAEEQEAEQVIIEEDSAPAEETTQDEAPASEDTPVSEVPQEPEPEVPQESEETKEEPPAEQIQTPAETPEEGVDQPEEDGEQPVESETPEDTDAPSKAPDTTVSSDEPSVPEEDSNPAEEEAKPAEEDTKPAEDESKPAEEDTAAPDVSEEKPEEPTPAEEPASEPEELPAQPAEEEEKVTEPIEEEESIDFDGLLSLEELTALDDETVDATMWESEAAPYGMRRARSRSMKSWSFDAYYVNQDDRYDVTKTSNFNLKYQMEFHASGEDLEPGAVKIRIPNVLFQDRNKADVTPNDIGVPKGERVWKDDGTLDTDACTPNRNTPFNYYVDGNDLVFFNYKTIKAGTNAAWQVLYKNLRLMNIVDGTEWTLTPEIQVREGGFESTTELTGKVDSSVSLTSVLKTPYQDTKLNYTPGLYTVSQIERYIDGSLDSKYIDQDGRLDTSAYRFVVWDVKFSGNATQPWDLSIIDSPTAEGEVVGYLDNSNRSTAYGLEIQEPVMGSDDPTRSSVDQREESWGSRFYVVTAYPADQVGEGDLVQNNLTIRLHPTDGQDEDVELAASPAGWTYKNYDWTYSGNVIGIEKKTDDTVYTGWLDAYAKAKVNGSDYGEMPFTTTAHMNGYSATHEVEGDNIGKYIPQSYYTMTTADDMIYLHPTSGDAGVMMDGNDYYFSSVTIEQTDYGYDIWEDKMTDSELGSIKEEELPENFDSSVRIYAMFGAEDEKEKGWQLVGTKPVDETGHMEPYTFDEDTIARQPWRVKVEHNSIDYRSTCQIDVNVCLKQASPRMQEIVDKRPSTKDSTSPVVQIENLSGTMAQAYREDGTVISYTDEDDQYQNYDDFGLEAETKAIYDGSLLVRDNAYRNVTWLTMTAASFKEAKSSNDVDNNRGLVEYMLTAYDGYEIYDKSCLDYLSENDQDLISPGRNYVVFYDLLPYGMNFDASYPVTAGRITNLDSNGNYKTQPRLWDTTQVKVSVNSDEIITDYRGTGRTLIPFRITFEGADATSYTAQKWIEGWGVHFRAYYDWKDMDAINQKVINSNISAFMPDFGERAGGDNDTHPALCGLANEVYLDNGKIENNEYLKKACADLIEGGDIDKINHEDKEGNKFDETYRNVLYANHTLMDDIAISSESKIEKLVRADADRLGTFSESAVVPEDDTYSYSLTVLAGPIGQTGIVVYDRLENAAVDLKEEEFEQNPWHGTFEAVDISALEKQGIEATIYYNANQDAVISEEKQKPEEALTEDNGWLTKEAFITSVQERIAADENADGKDHSWQEYVKAVAVDLGDFYLEALHSVSFQVKMRSPKSKPEGSGNYAYNNASFYAVPSQWEQTYDEETERWQSVLMKKENEAVTVAGSSVRVGLDKTERLEIIKRVSGDLPESRMDETFEFQVYEEYAFHREMTKHPLAFTEYRLYKADKEGNWTLQEDQVYATNGNGYLYLKQDEKAVFSMADADRIKIKESENVFWESKETESESGTEDDSPKIRTVTVTNTFRPVLYVQKGLSGVPDGVTINDSDKTFTFRLERKDQSGTYVPVADSEYWYVDSARTDGNIPNKLGTGRTSAEGTFRLKAGEIIALFPGVVGTEYRLTETDAGADWICTDTDAVGKLSVQGSNKIFTNYYKWKNLQITKQITHQSQDAYDAQNEELKIFTFRIVKTLTNPDGSPMLDGDGNAITAKKSENSSQEATAGLTWVMLDADGNEMGGEGNRGTLNDNGEFSCALGFRTVRIKGLEAEKTYLVTEVGVPKDSESNKPLYQAVNDTVEVQMPVFSSKKDAEFTNDYQRRSLSVSKTLVTESAETELPGGGIIDQGGQTILSLSRAQVSSGGNLNMDIIDDIGSGSQGGSEDVEFTFYLEINGAKKAGYPYTVTRQGAVVRKDSTGKDGSFFLSDGETAVFEAVGMLEDSFKVSEKQDDKYQQIYPSEKEPHSGTLTGEGVEVSFVNGSEGMLYLSKEYVATEGDGTSEQYVADLKEAVKASYIKSDEESFEIHWDIQYQKDGERLEDSAVEFILEVTEADGTSYTWPTQNTSVSYMNQLTGERFPVMWQANQSIKMYPYYMVAIPMGEEGDIPSDAVYTLREAEDDQHRIINYWPASGWFMQNLQLSQSYPEDDQAIVGIAQEKPIATIYNEAKTLNVESAIRKYMTDSSSEVPTGAKLVWRLEKFVGEDVQSGRWVPAEGIPYVVWETPSGKVGSGNFTTPVSDRIETTGKDGKIILSKTENGYPEVTFTENKVYLNLYREDRIGDLLSSDETDGPLLRLVEVAEESDAEWGKLAGYFSEDMYNTYDKNYGLSIFCAPYYKFEPMRPSVNGFVNSNKMSPVEVQKKMSIKDIQPDRPFTMILKQVVSINSEELSEVPEMIKKEIVTEPRKNIPYTVYNADGTKAGEHVTGENGEIELYAGQYAALNLPEDSYWTVEEDDNAAKPYLLKDLKADPDGNKMIKLDKNLMLINLWIPSVTYTLSYDGNENTGGTVPAQSVKTVKEGESAEFEIPLDTPTKDGHKFLGWSEDQHATEASYQPGGMVTLSKDLTLYAVWQRTRYTVTYYNGDTMVRKVSWDTAVWESYTIPRLTHEMEEKPGYEHTGWSLQPDALIPDYGFGEVILLTEDITLYAVWERTYRVIYRDGLGGRVFGDVTHGKLKNGDETPAFKGTLTHPAYEFMGWNPTVNPIVSGDDANKDGEIIYTATWKVKTQ